MSEISESDTIKELSKEFIDTRIQIEFRPIENEINYNMFICNRFIKGERTFQLLKSKNVETSDKSYRTDIVYNNKCVGFEPCELNDKSMTS